MKAYDTERARGRCHTLKGHLVKTTMLVSVPETERLVLVRGHSDVFHSPRSLFSQEVCLMGQRQGDANNRARFKKECRLNKYSGKYSAQHTDIQ